ncbi:MAG TPA: hypothetical protein VJG90_08055 [Candidatus Nanoarchaeia archaeon]|nr:hypothetical protein [Candidatus Nanoarchaeia archaeon]
MPFPPQLKDKINRVREGISALNEFDYREKPEDPGEHLKWLNRHGANADDLERFADQDQYHLVEDRLKRYASELTHFVSDSEGYQYKAFHQIAAATLTIV